MKRVISVVLAFGLLAAVFVPALAGSSAVPCLAQYTVLPGDNLFRIGVSFGVTWPQIAVANNLANPSLILPGQILCIPVNGTGTPEATPTATTVPPPVPTVIPVTFLIPTFSIVSVVKDTSVTILTANFPANQDFNVTMGPIGSLGLGGVSLGTTNSGVGGAFTATFNTPAQFAGTPQIAIRMQSASGFFAFNWFWNFNAP